MKASSGAVELSRNHWPGLEAFTSHANAAVRLRLARLIVKDAAGHPHERPNVFECEYIRRHGLAGSGVP